MNHNFVVKATMLLFIHTQVKNSLYAIAGLEESFLLSLHKVLFSKRLSRNSGDGIRGGCGERGE